ncbi:hypothetical protein K456DRAFT_1788268, partial [Colletotrichum gloeosporioides 23]
MPTGDIHGDAGPHPAGAAGGGIAAPYGRACTNCSRAKCKCILRPAGGACERCHRLNKTCQPSNPQRKRSKKPPSSRTAQLEEKLDGLVTLLRQSGGRPELVDMANISGVVGGGPAGVAASASSSSQDEASGAADGWYADRGSRDDGAGAGVAGAARGTSLPTPTQTASPEGTGYGDGDDFLPSPDEAEALFESF